MNNLLQKRERIGASFSLNISTEMLLNEKLSSQVLEFSVENCPNGSLAKVGKFHTNPLKLVACQPNPYKLAVLGDISRAIILPFSSSKYFYSCSTNSQI